MEKLKANGWAFDRTKGSRHIFDKDGAASVGSIPWQHELGR